MMKRRELLKSIAALAASPLITHVLSAQTCYLRRRQHLFKKQFPLPER